VTITSLDQAMPKGSGYTQAVALTDQ